MAVARVTKITASSPKGFKEAVEEGLKRATKTLVRGVLLAGLAATMSGCVYTNPPYGNYGNGSYVGYGGYAYYDYGYYGYGYDGYRPYYGGN